MNMLETKMQRSRGKASRMTPQKSDTGGTSPCQRDLRSKETPEKTNVKSSGQVDLNPEGDNSRETEELPYMTTTEMYLCCWQQPPASPLQEECPKIEEDVASKCLVQMQNGRYKHWFSNSNTKNISLVPSWRENIMEPIQEEDAVDIPEVRVIICIIYVLYISHKNLVWGPLSCIHHLFL